MEEQIPLIIQIPCDNLGREEGRYYYVNYPSVESLKRRGVPKDWEEEESEFSVIKEKKVTCRKLRLYQGTEHVATLLVDVEAKEGNRLIEVQLEVGNNWLRDNSSEDILAMGGGWYAFYSYFGSAIYWSSGALQNEQKRIKPERQSLIKAIQHFVTKIVYLSDGFPQGEKLVNKKARVEQILTDYVALNPHIRNASNFLGVPGQPIVIPDATWKVHKQQLRKLTERGCISMLSSNFHHDDLDLALKIAANPQLARCYGELEKVPETEKITKLNEVCTALASEEETIDLTGMDFTKALPLYIYGAVTFEPGRIMAGKEALFDDAVFVRLILIGESGKGGNWSNTSLRYASFINSELPGIDFTRADLTGANFKSTNLTGAILSDANIVGANFEGADLTDITWPCVQYWGDGVFQLPKLDWNRWGAEFIMQQLDRIRDLPIDIEGKQTRAKALFDSVFPKITTSEELVKFAALIEGKETRFAYLRQETAFFRGAFFGCHGNTDPWHDIIGKLKIHLDTLLLEETYSNTQEEGQQAQDIHTMPRKTWENKEQLEAFQKIMAEHRGRWFGEVTHTKLYTNYSDGNECYTDLPQLDKDMKKLRDSYIDQDAGFKETIEGQRPKTF